MSEEKPFDFWQDHSINYIKMAFSTEQMNIPEHPDAYGKNKGTCGDMIEMFLTVQNDYILSAAFNMDGCINTRASANTVVMMIVGKTIHEAWRVTPEDVIGYLETLPQGFEHCAELAVGALYKALANYQELKHHSWKKLYQKR
jgi:nitrogen fixation NifU-like protein